MKLKEQNLDHLILNYSGKVKAIIAENLLVLQKLFTEMKNTKD